MSNLLSKIFWNAEEDRLRAPVRLVCQLGVTIACVFASILGIGLSLSYGRGHGLLSTVNKQTFDQIGNMIVAPIAAAVIYLSLRIGSRKIERRDFSVYGASLSLTWAKQFLMGFVLSAALMTFIFAVEYFAGWIRIEGHFGVTQPGNILSISLLYSLVKVVIVGICEELVFRGLVLRSFAEGFSGLGDLGTTTSKALALLLSAFLFGIVHLTNPNSGLASTAGIFFIGIFFGLGYLGTGKLAVPMGLHMAWNLFQGTVYGFPVSGDKEPASFLLTRQMGPGLATGGGFGPEAGLIGMLAAILGVFALLLYLQKRAVT